MLRNNFGKTSTGCTFVKSVVVLYGTTNCFHCLAFWRSNSYFSYFARLVQKASSAMVCLSTRVRNLKCELPGSSTSRCWGLRQRTKKMHRFFSKVQALPYSCCFHAGSMVWLMHFSRRQTVLYGERHNRHFKKHLQELGLSAMSCHKSSDLKKNLQVAGHVHIRIL